MWPITVRVLQDTDGWMVAAQFLSALAIGYAAWVAANYQKKRDKNHQVKREIYYCSVLKQLKSTCNSLLILGEEVGEITKDTYLAIINEIRVTNDILSMNFVELVEYCPFEVIEKIQLVQLQVRSIFLDLGEYNEFHSRFDDSIALVRETWDRVLPSLDKSIAIIEKDIESRKAFLKRVFGARRNWKDAEQKLNR